MTSRDDPRLEQGREIRKVLMGGERKERPAYVQMVPQLDEWIDSALFGDIWSRPGLDYKTRSIAAMAALCVLGHHAELRNHVDIALNLGWAKEEIAELFMHLIFYGGGPTALNGLRVASEVFKERGLID